MNQYIEKKMANITLKGNPINTLGELPSISAKAKDFQLVAKDLSSKSLNDFAGKNLVLNIFPSIDTGTCATSVRNFNKVAADLDNTLVLCISRDLPFAQSRFCGAEGIENVVMLSDFKTGQFGKDYRLNILEQLEFDTLDISYTSFFEFVQIKDIPLKTLNLSACRLNEINDMRIGMLKSTGVETIIYQEKYFKPSEIELLSKHFHLIKEE